LREIREETTLQVTDIKTAYSFSEYSTEKKYYFLLIAFSASALAESVILSDEHSEYQWVTKEEYMTME
jgi:8-oxo-dGTP pyrophosphatase MutT (NUDIX family)